MAAFPAITPDERSYDLGLVPVEEFRGEGTVAILFRTGTIAVGQRLTLPFSSRPLADVEAVWDHYKSQQRELFTLPAEAWCGHTDGAAMADAGLRWRYVEAPTVERVSFGNYTVTVTLEAVGVGIGATGGGATLASGTTGAIVAGAIDVLPSRPAPIPPPTPGSPTTTTTPPAEIAAPAAEVAVAGAVELRHSSIGLPESGQVAIGEDADLTYTPPP